MSRNTGHVEAEPAAGPTITAIVLLLVMLGFAGVVAYLAAGAGLL